MEFKKGLLKAVTSIFAFAGIVALGTTSQATISTSGKLLKLNNPTYRGSGYAYRAGLKSTSGIHTQDMWKIYEYNSNGETIKNLNNGIYCIKMGVGFGSSNGTQTEQRTYTIYADMKNPTEADKTIIDSYKANIPSEKNYNSLIWVLDHCYVPAPSNSPTNEQIETAAKYRKELLTNAKIPNSKINDDLIDIVQQIAIWYFTNDDKYKADELTNIQAKLKTDLDYDSIEDVFNDWNLVTNDTNPNDLGDVYMLYNYFIEGGKANKDTNPNTTITNPVELTQVGAKVVASNGSYIAGPYKINKLSDIVYTLDGKLTDEQGNNISYTLLDSDKKETTKTLAELVGTEFYLKIPSTASVNKAKLKLTTTVMQNTITYWTVANSNNDQPVAEIVPEEKQFEQEVELKLSDFDLALRKFITNINGKELIDTTTGKYLREPSIDVTPLVNGTDTTAIYKHPKDPIGVAVGDIVIYTLRIYNEGQIDGYAKTVTDYLPEQLEFVMNDEENFNAKYGWQIDSSLRKASTNYLDKQTVDPEDTLIKAFDGTTLDYKELKIKCKVKSTKDLDKVITNIAEITEFIDANGNLIKDRDSEAGNIVLPTDENLPDYKGKDTNKSVLTDKEYFYKGQEDDDDFEKLILEEFDLALRKFITKVNDQNITNRIPVFTKDLDKNGNYIYKHTKEPIEVESTDIVEYTIRIYNEGDISGYAKEVKDDIPEGLEFLPDNSTNKEYRWVMLDKNGNKTTDVSKAKYITTDYLSKEQEKTEGSNLIKTFNIENMVEPYYKDVKVAFKVVASNTYKGIITNVAEISDDSDAEGKEVEDRDSTPNNNDFKEDDIDVEHIKLSYFDLALRKFITKVNDTEITNRVPKFKIDENGNYVYEHTKEPVEVENGNIITYTLRVFNEGTKDGYAKEIKDDLPEGLEFLPENETNKTYRWVMLDKEGKETTNIEDAVSIKTDYLSKEQEKTEGSNLIKAFDSENMEEPDHKDVKIAFKITEPSTSDRILINKAQISDDSDKDGKDVIDIDSTPDKWIEGEDDQDIEKVKVKYFDLALRKWVTQAIVIDNGKETVVETGHKPEDDPEEVVKVEIKESRLNKVVVKFRYSIRVYNEGEIAGYAKEVKDYIPEGLKFVQADNPEWKQLETGEVVTDQLKDTLLQPGEYADVEILLTWINGKNNFGLKVNVAEISKDYNDSNTPDIDSTPDNRKEDEDDIDDAPVILTVKTGAGLNKEYVILVTATLAILTSGVVLIKKYVL